MNPEEYSAKQAIITAAVAVFVYQFAQFWAASAMSPVQWLRFLQFLWPEVQRRRQESSVLARQFYDAQRLSYFPSLPLNETPLEGSDFDVFVQNMEPVRKKMSQADSPNDAVTRLTLQVVREVENAGRRQIINAVKNDEAVAEVVEQQPTAEVDTRTIPPTEEPLNLRNTRREIAQQGRSKLIRGWARVATGRETCGWCLMLISRGPEYYEASSAGLDLDDASAVEMIAAGEDVKEYMEEWHTGCDCRVVPVFKLSDWENSPYGKASKRALDMWNEATREARELLEERGTRVHTRGKNKGGEFTLNEEAVLALRRRLESGELNPIEYAGLAA